MKSLFRKFSIVLIVLVIGFTSCSKDDDSTPQPPTTAELLAHKWFIVKQEDSSTSPPTLSFTDDCSQNIYYNFLDDGSFYIERYAINMGNCESIGALAGTYFISEDESQVVVSIELVSVTEILTIETLTETELVLVNGNLTAFFER